MLRRMILTIGAMAALVVGGVTAAEAGRYRGGGYPTTRYYSPYRGYTGTPVYRGGYYGGGYYGGGYYGGGLYNSNPYYRSGYSTYRPYYPSYGGGYSGGYGSYYGGGVYARPGVGVYLGF